jgi:hypothetical protein
MIDFQPFEPQFTTLPSPYAVRDRFSRRPDRLRPDPPLSGDCFTAGRANSEAVTLICFLALIVLLVTAFPLSTAWDQELDTTTLVT